MDVLCMQAERWLHVPPMARGPPNLKEEWQPSWWTSKVQLCALLNSDHGSPHHTPPHRTQALCDFQTGMGEIPKWTPADSTLKIQTNCNYKKISYCFLHTFACGLKFIPIISGEPSGSSWLQSKIKDTSFWGSGHDAMGGLVYMEEVNSQKSLLTLGILTGLRCIQIWKGTT